MEFTGKIIKLLQTRSGVSQRTGNQWKTLPFVFEYKEDEKDRVNSRVILETFDTKVMEQIAPFVELGEDGKPIIENGEMKMKQFVDALCGFDHFTNTAPSGRIFNELRLYKMEVLSKAPEKTEEQKAEEAKNNSFSDLTPADNLPF